MAQETTLATADQARRVRRRVARVGRAALTRLAAELKRLAPNKRLSEAWCRKYKLVADQLRRDYRLEPAEEHAPTITGFQPAAAAEPDADPLAGLRVVSAEEDVA